MKTSRGCSWTWLGEMGIVGWGLTWILRPPRRHVSVHPEVTTLTPPSAGRRRAVSARCTGSSLHFMFCNLTVLTSPAHCVFSILFSGNWPLLLNWVGVALGNFSFFCSTCGWVSQKTLQCWYFFSNKIFASIAFVGFFCLFYV